MTSPRWGTLRRDAICLAVPLLLVVLYVLVTHLAITLGTSDAPPRLWRGTIMPFALGVLGWMVVYAGGMLRGRPWRTALAATLRPGRVAGAAALLIASAVFFNSFSHYKGSIQLIQPFAFDVQFAELDRLLHLGRHPWEWLQPLLGSPATTSLIDWLYYAWFPVGLVTTTLWAWHEDPARRARFFVAYFGTWALLGSGLATLLSSAGPCYYSLIGLGPDPYAGLMAYLHDVDLHRPLTALRVQGMLWEGYVGADRSPEGIAAMPSLHVAIPILFALAAGWRSWLGRFFGVFAFITFIGSIHLGWHYAIDGYVAAAGVAAIWWGSGRIVRKTEAGSGSVA